MNSYNLVGLDINHVKKRTEYLVGRLGEDSFLPEVGSQVAVGLSNGSVGCLG